MTEKTKQIDPKEFREKLDKIVDQLFMQAGSRETVTSIINELHDEYGLKKPLVRKVASKLYKEATGNDDDIEDEVKELLKLYRE